MAAVFCLAVDLGVEIHVMQDDGIGTREIQTLPPCPRAQQECKNSVLLVVEPAQFYRSCIYQYSVVLVKMLETGMPPMSCFLYNTFARV